MKLKKIVSAALAGAMLASTALIGVTAAETNTLPFTDVNAKDWFYGAVQEAYDEGIMTGKSDTVFDPRANITRAEVVTAFARVACTNIEGKGDSLTFTDTKSGKWYSDAVGWAADNGIVKGRGDGRFSPSDNITRAELASILVNFLNYMEITLPDNPQIDKFDDADTFDGWMKEPVEAVRKNGLMQGVGGMFNPTGTASRGEIAEVVKNLLPGVGRNVVVEDGKTDYVIVIDTENAGAVDAADRMVWQIEEVCGVTMKVVDDGTAETAKEIVLGATSRGKKIDTANLEKDSYKIAVDAEKIYIGGATAEGIYKGAVNFMNTCTSGDNVRFTAKSAEVDLFEYPIGKLTINGNNINKYKILYPTPQARLQTP